MDDKLKFTPGPWSVSTPEDGVSRPWLESCPSGAIGVQSDGTAFALGVTVAACHLLADARLIAAAPKMYEALQELLAVRAEPAFPRPADQRAHEARERRAWEAARAALAMVEGK